MAKHKSTIALNLSIFILMTGVGMIVSLLPGKILSLSGSIYETGYLASLFAVSFILFQLPVGTLASKLGCKTFLVLGCLTCGLTGLLYSHADHINIVFAGRVLQGLGEVPVWALAPAMLSQYHPSQKGKAVGFYNAFIHLGLMAGSYSGVLLSGLWTGNEPYMFFAYSGLASGMLLLFLLKEPEHGTLDDQRIDRKNILLLVKTVRNIPLLSGIMLYGCGYGILLTIIPAHMIKANNFSPGEVGMLFTVTYTALGGSQISGGYLSDRYGTWYIMTGGLTMATAGLLLLSNSNHAFSGLAITASGLGAFCVSALSHLNGNVPDFLKGSVSGFFYACWGIGFFAGPLIIGQITASGYFTSVTTALACSFFLTAFFLGKNRLILQHK